MRLKGKFYKTAIRPAMLYGTECWAVKKQYVRKMNVAKMRMLRWSKMIEIASIEEKIRENQLRWFGHIQSKPINVPIRKSEAIHIEGNVRGRGRPKLTWVEIIKKYFVWLWLLLE